MKIAPPPTSSLWQARAEQAPDCDSDETGGPVPQRQARNHVPKRTARAKVVVGPACPARKSGETPGAAIDSVR